MYVPRTPCPVGLSGYRGLACGPQCKCGGACGMGRARGMGLFDSLDFTTWGWGEIGVILIGGYLIVNLLGDIGTGSRRARQYVKSSQRKRLAARRKAVLAKAGLA